MKLEDMRGVKDMTKTERDFFSYHARMIYGRIEGYPKEMDPLDFIKAVNALIDERIKAAMPKQKYLVQVEETLLRTLHPNWDGLTQEERNGRLDSLSEKIENFLLREDSPASILNFFKDDLLSGKELGKITITPVLGEVVKTEII